MNIAKKDELKLSRETRTVQILGFEEESSGALMPPVHFATTFARDAEHYQTPQGRSYLRCDGPTQELAEQVLADLEGASAALVFSSGIAACTAPRVRSEACTVPRTYRRVCAAAPRTYRRVLPECAAGSRHVQRATQRRIALLASHKSRALVAVDLFSTCVFSLSFEHVSEVKISGRLRG